MEALTDWKDAAFTVLPEPDTHYSPLPLSLPPPMAFKQSKQVTCHQIPFVSQGKEGKASLGVGDTAEVCFELG